MALLTRAHTVGSDRIYEGEIIRLRVDRLEHPGGARYLREVVEHNGGVVIASRPAPDKVILIKQYRYSTDEDLIELPAGRLEPGEKPLPAAQRELEEETGYRAKNWREMTAFVTAPGFCNEVLHLFEATDLEFVGKRLDEDEETDVLIMPLAEAWDLVIKREIRDAKTIAGLALMMG